VSGEGGPDERSPVDVLLVSLGSTGGWRAADEELAESLRRAGASLALAAALPPRPVRTFMLTDLTWARAARRAADGALRRHDPRAIIYSTTTAALLWPAPGAIRFDAPAARNRPGRHGLWQRPLERRRLRETPLLLPMSEGALRECPSGALAGERTLVLPMPVEPSGPGDGRRDIAAVTYAANPAKKDTARVLRAWARARGPSDELVVAGCERADLERAGLDRGQDWAGVRVVGALPAADYRALLRRARVFVCAPRREDYGIAQLEALADGCLLVSAPAPGPYPALALARALEHRLVDEDVVGALRAALALDDAAAIDYRERAALALRPFRRESVDALVREQLVPRLLGRARAYAAS
jgi:glycosyltransferase involved in cell wall biosynthesis